LDRPGFFLPVRVLPRLFRRLFLEKIVAEYEAGGRHFFADHAPLAEPGVLAAYLVPLRKAECRGGEDIAIPTPVVPPQVG
jgi:hypothetical protein